MRRSMQRTLLFDLYSRGAEQRMRLAGGSDRLPPHLKHQLLRRYARDYGLGVLIETGTYLGTTVRRVRDQFSRIVSIELDEILASEAKAYFADDPGVLIIQGDSSEVLPDVLRGLDVPALFWLDAHYSGGFTARAASDTPIVRELESVLGHPVRKHVILIDDIREFGSAGYPAPEWVEDLVVSQRPDLAVAVQDDVMRIVPT